MEMWKISDERAEAASAVAAGAPKPLIVTTGGVRVVGGAGPAVAKVSGDVPASPGAVTVRKMGPRPAAAEAMAVTAGAAPRPSVRAEDPMPLAPVRVEIGPTVAPPPSSARGNASLLPPRGPSTARPAGSEVAPGGGEAPHVRRIGGDAAPARHAPQPAVASVLGTALGADVFDDDGPILVVENLPSPDVLFDRTAIPLQERTFYVRYDSAAVAGVVGALLLSVAFMLGRTSGTEVHALALAAEPQRGAEVALAGAPATGPSAAASEAPLPRVSLSTAFEMGPEEPAPAAPGASTQASAASSTGASAAAPSGSPGARGAAASAPATPEPEFAIMAVAGIPRKNAEAVVAFLGKHGFQARIVGTGDRCGVVVGAYAEKKGPALEADQAKVRALVYVDGKKPFASAYAYPLKRK